MTDRRDEHTSPYGIFDSKTAKKKSEDWKNIKKRQWQFYDEVCEFIKGSSSARFFLHTLIRYANDKNCCWRTIDKFAQSMGVSNKTVMRSVKQLEQLKIIKVIKKRASRTKSHPNVYVLNFDCELLNSAVLPSNIEACSLLDSDIVSDATDYKTKCLIGDTQVTNKGTCRPLVRDTVSLKYKKNKNINIKRVLDSNLQSSSDNSRLNRIDPDLMNMWFHTKGFLIRNGGKNLSQLPSEEDLSAMHWVIENFSLDPKSKKDCTAICEFVTFELKEPTNVFNPLVRLKAAAETHPQGINQFLGRYKKFRKTLK